MEAKGAVSVCHLLITFANSLGPDQLASSDSFLKKKLILKKSQQTTKKLLAITLHAELKQGQNWKILIVCCKF